MGSPAIPDTGVLPRSDNRLPHPNGKILPNRAYTIAQAAVLRSSPDIRGFPAAIGRVSNPVAFLPCQGAYPAEAAWAPSACQTSRQTTRRWLAAGPLKQPDRRSWADKITAYCPVLLWSCTKTRSGVKETTGACPRQSSLFPSRPVLYAGTYVTGKCLNVRPRAIPPEYSRPLSATSKKPCSILCSLPFVVTANLHNKAD